MGAVAAAFGDALNLNIHFHSLVFDGIHLRSDRSLPRFHPLPPPGDPEVAGATAAIARRLGRVLERRGQLDANPIEADPLAGDDSLLAEVYATSVRGRIASGPRAGRRVVRLGDRVHADDVERGPGERCARFGGVSLHANVSVPARDRARVERLCRYVARPPVATRGGRAADSGSARPVRSPASSARNTRARSRATCCPQRRSRSRSVREAAARGPRSGR